MIAAKPAIPVPTMATEIPLPSISEINRGPIHWGIYVPLPRVTPAASIAELARFRAYVFVPVETLISSVE